MDKPNLNMRQHKWLDAVKDYDCEILYHPGKANLVIDDLIQKSVGSSDRVMRMRITVDSPFLGLISEAQDEVVRKEKWKHEMTRGEIDRFVIDSRGLFTRCGRVWVPISSGIRKIVLEEAYKSHFSIHLGDQDVSGFEVELLVAMYEEGDNLACGEILDLQDGQG